MTTVDHASILLLGPRRLLLSLGGLNSHTRVHRKSINVSVEYTVSNDRQLDLLVTPVVGRPDDALLSDFAVAFTGSFAWVLRSCLDDNRFPCG